MFGRFSAIINSIVPLFKGFIILLFIFSFIKLSAQKINLEKLWIGINQGHATQNLVPIYNKNYIYKSDYYKLQLVYNFKEKKKQNFLLNVEPSIYYSQYQLLNPGFIGPRRGDDYLEQRIKFSQYRRFNEYALNFGFVYEYKLLNKISLYALASVGPMFGEKDTERLKKGFAFSDIFGLGTYLSINRFRLDLRTIIRHNSNAGLRLPNNGHNSVGFEAGLSYQLQYRKD